MNKTQIFLVGLLILSAQSLILSCGRAISSGARAEVVPANTGGVTCYIIRDDDGKGVGGNCLKD